MPVDMSEVGHSRDQFLDKLPYLVDLVDHAHC
jgi:hypothetical protein